MGSMACLWMNCVRRYLKVSSSGTSGKIVDHNSVSFDTSGGGRFQISVTYLQLLIRGVWQTYRHWSSPHLPAKSSDFAEETRATLGRLGILNIFHNLVELSNYPCFRQAKRGRFLTPAGTKDPSPVRVELVLGPFLVVFLKLNTWWVTKP
eukprot:gene20094-biopygen6506